jgi:hypothetical protein
MVFMVMIIGIQTLEVFPVEDINPQGVVRSVLGHGQYG